MTRARSRIDSLPQTFIRKEQFTAHLTRSAKDILTFGFHPIDHRLHMIDKLFQCIVMKLRVFQNGLQDEVTRRFSQDEAQPTYTHRINLSDEKISEERLPLLLRSLKVLSGILFDQLKFIADACFSPNSNSSFVGLPPNHLNPSTAEFGGTPYSMQYEGSKYYRWVGFRDLHETPHGSVCELILRSDMHTAKRYCN